MENNIKYIFIVGMLWSILTGCNKLDETVYSSIYTSQFYKTSSDAEAGIAAVYSSLADLYGSNPAPLIDSDFSADQIYPRVVVGRNCLPLFSYDVYYTQQVSAGRAYESPYHIWQKCYAGIERANIVIENMAKPTMNEIRRSEILGEAYFLRAFFNWMLTKNFGDIIIKTSSSKTLEDAFSSKSPKADVYNQIFSDLALAVPILPDYSTGLVKGRASRQAALALYAKAALYDEKYDVALEKANLVITSGKHSLMADYKDAFDVTKEDAARLENIFALESEGHATPSRSNQLSSLYAPQDGIEYSKNAWYQGFFAYPAFFASFSDDDARKKMMATSYVNSKGQIIPQDKITTFTKTAVLIKKYQDPISTTLTSSNVRLLSYPDVLLIAAEAEARLNGATATAYGFVNRIRTRAGLPNLTSGLSKDAFIEAVLQERSWELFGEGDRWYDLTRTNTFLTVIPKAVNDVYPVRAPSAKHRYFPIPQYEIDANPKLEQNPDWK